MARTPPSMTEIVTEAKQLACQTLDKLNPVNLSTCRTAMKQPLADSVREQRLAAARTFRNQLSVYKESEAPFSERSFRLSVPNNNACSAVVMSSTKNSDHTIAYWLQFPVLDVHIKMAMCRLLGLVVNTQNMTTVEQTYSALYEQCKHMLQREIVACDKVDPLFVAAAIRALYLNGYVAQPIENVKL